MPAEVRSKRELNLRSITAAYELHFIGDRRIFASPC
jgi:hypothetical protein